MTGSEDEVVYFKDVVSNNEHYEVSRMFAATLQLVSWQQ